VSGTDAAWVVGRLTIGTLVRVFGRLRVYGRDRVPATGGVVYACNHFHWVDPAALGAASPRTVYFMAKMEAHRVPGVGQLIRFFGTFPVRRGESDREAVRTMRKIVHEGHTLGLFAEGTRQRSGVPGEIQLPADGIYAGWFERADGSVWPTAMSLGRRPTFYEHADASLLECHLLDFDGDLYGEPVRVRFLERLRGEERFDSVDELVAQMARDCGKARALLDV